MWSIAEVRSLVDQAQGMLRDPGLGPRRSLARPSAANDTERTSRLT